MKARAKEAAMLKRLEMRLQLPSVRTSRPQLEAMLADDFTEFASSGVALNKRQTIAAILADPAAGQPRYAALQNLKVIWLAPDTALLTYRSSKSQSGNARAVRALRCSVWQKADGRWQLLFHQGTPVFGRSPA